MSHNIYGQPVPSLYRFYTIDVHGNENRNFGYHVAADEGDLEIIKENIGELCEDLVTGEIWILRFEKVELHFTPYFHDIFIHGKKYID